jgi:hypothetical protein
MGHVWTGVQVGALLLCAAWPAASHGQSPPPPRRGDDATRPLQTKQDGGDAAAPQFTTYTGKLPPPVDQIPSWDDMIGYLEVLCAVLGTIAAAWVLVRVCSYYARPDPKKYIMNDPWVQARLAQKCAPTDQSPEEPPPT